MVSLSLKSGGICLWMLFTFYGEALPASPFKVLSDTIYYDTVNDVNSDGIEYQHQDELLKLLKENTEVTKIILNSGGGMISPAEEMSALIIDAKLDTHVEFECASACVTMFLGGQTRTLALGGKLGFHKSFWAADNIEKYYNTGLEEGDWVSFFDFASWLYEDAQADVFKAFEYLLERGVRPAFAIETLKAGTDGMWYPRRKHLIDGGVLTQ